MTVSSRIARTGLVAVVVAAGVVAGSSAAQGAASKCATSDLTAKVTGTAAGMSQPSTFVTVTNSSDSSCWVKGYPTITRARTKAGRVAISVTHGGVQNAPSVKVKKVTLKPGGQAWFAVGTATAYDPPVRTLTRLAVAIDPGTAVADSLKVKVSQQATAPAGKPIPVGVTPFAKGTQTGD